MDFLPLPAKLAELTDAGPKGPLGVYTLLKAKTKLRTSTGRRIRRLLDALLQPASLTLLCKKDCLSRVALRAFAWLSKCNNQVSMAD